MTHIVTVKMGILTIVCVANTAEDTMQFFLLS